MKDPGIWWSSGRGSSPLPSSDEAFLKRALRLAARGRYGVAPNPMVGAVVVRDGAIVGSGFHRRVGAPHAEAVALAAAGDRTRGATLYATLEPCSHQGRTPPCTAAIIAAGISEVVVCHRDPNPDVAGGGLEVLQRAGIVVRHGFLVAEAVRLNLRYLVALVRRRPAVTLKWAMSLDGRIATSGGESQWISSPAGRRWGLLLREENDAVLVGSGTLLADDPRLDRRLERAPGPVLKVVLDRRLRTPPEARLLGSPGEVLIYTESRAEEAASVLAGRGAEVVTVARVTPEVVLEDLHRRGVQSVLVEGGAQVLGAFADAGAFDRVAIDCAPLLVGGRGAPGPLAGTGATALAVAYRLEEITVGRRGGDVVLTAVRRGCLAELSQSVA